MVDVIHIHEDDCGMRNLYPLAALTEAEKDIAEAAAAAERNRCPSGLGYTDIYIATPPSTDYTDVGLSIVDVEQALTPIFPRVRFFNATILSAIGSDQLDPYGSYEEDAWCFGLGKRCYMKLETKGSMVSQIWFDLHTNDSDEIQQFRKAVEAINKLTPSIIVDYFLDFVGVVSNSNVLNGYLAALEERQHAAERFMLEYRTKREYLAKSKGIFSRLFAHFTNRDK